MSSLLNRFFTDPITIIKMDGDFNFIVKNQYRINIIITWSFSSSKSVIVQGISISKMCINRKNINTAFFNIVNPRWVP